MITSHPSAPLGEVATLRDYEPSLFIPPCAILCRNNAPLVAFAYGLLQRDIPCRILGRDIGTALSKIVKNMRATTLDDCTDRLRTWYSREVEKAEKDGQSPERLSDQYNCLLFFIRGLDEDSRTVASLLAKIDLMFGEATDKDLGSRVVLCSIHKSKGLEWPLVFLLDRELIPSKYALSASARKQEANLGYVAVTRSMSKLFYISSDCWKTQN